MSVPCPLAPVFGRSSSSMGSHFRSSTIAYRSIRRGAQFSKLVFDLIMRSFGLVTVYCIRRSVSIKDRWRLRAYALRARSTRPLTLDDRRLTLPPFGSSCIPRIGFCPDHSKLHSPV